MMMEALPLCVGLLARLPVRDLRALKRIGYVKGEAGGEDDDDVAAGGGGKGLAGMAMYDQDNEGGGGGGRDEGGDEAERKLHVEAAKALKRKKVAVYRYGVRGGVFYLDGARS